MDTNDNQTPPEPQIPFGNPGATPSVLAGLRSMIDEELPELPRSFESIWSGAREDFSNLAQASEEDQAKLKAAMESLARLGALRVMHAEHAAEIDREIAFVVQTVKFMGARYALDVATIAHRYADLAAQTATSKVFGILATIIRAAV